MASTPISNAPDVSSLQNNPMKHKEGRHAQITALALAMIAIVLYSSALVFYGIGTLPPTTFSGLGMFATLGGVFISFVALEVLFGAVSFVLYSAYQSGPRCKSFLADSI